MRVEANGDITLETGDIVMHEFDLRVSTQGQMDLGIHSIKQSLANDKRFNYQGSEVVWIKDDDGRDVRVLRVYVQVAKGKQPTFAAGIAPIVIVVGLVILTGLLAGATMSVSHTLELRKKATMVNNVLVSDLTPQQKTEVIGDIMGNAPSLGAGVAAAGSSLMTAGLILGGIWAASHLLGKRARSSSGGDQGE